MPENKPPKRIKKLSWKHNGMKMACEVGGPLPGYFETGNEPVLEIVDCGDHYAIYTESRGGSYGPAVRAGKDKWSTETTETDSTISEPVFLRAVEVLGSPEAAIAWLKTTNPDLGDMRPVDRLRSIAGSQVVLDLLGRIKHGAPPLNRVGK